MPSNVKRRLWLPFHRGAGRIKSPSNLWKCQTETYFYANSADKCVASGSPFFRADLNCPPRIELHFELSYNCICRRGACGGGVLRSAVAFLQLRTLWDVTPPLNINLLHPALPLPALSSFLFIWSSSLLPSSLLSSCYSFFFFPSSPASDAFAFSFMLSIFHHLPQLYLKEQLRNPRGCRVAAPPLAGTHTHTLTSVLSLFVHQFIWRAVRRADMTQS